MPDCASFWLKQCHIFCMWQTTSAFRLLITIAHKSQRLKASVGKGAIKEAINWSSVISESGGQLNKPNKHKPTSFLYRLVQSWFTSLVLKAFSNTRTGLSITKMCPHHGTPAYCTWNEYSAPRKRGFNKLVCEWFSLMSHQCHLLLPKREGYMFLFEICPLHDWPSILCFSTPWKCFNSDRTVNIEVWYSMIALLWTSLQNQFKCWSSPNTFSISLSKGQISSFVVG